MQVSSIAQVVGVILCLNAAAKISHRAQGVAALATRWHALASCGPDDASHMRVPNETISSVSSESDLEAMNYIPLPTNTQLASNLSTYNRRQAFGKQTLSIKCKHNDRNSFVCVRLVFFFNNLDNMH